MVLGKRHPGYKYLLAGIDWLTLMTAFTIALRLRGRWIFGDLAGTLQNYAPEVAFLGLYSAVAILVYQHFSLYKVNVFITIVDHTFRLVQALAIVVIGLALVSFFLRTPWIVDSRLVILYFVAVVTVLSILVRVVLFRKIFIWLARNRILTRNVLIVGAGETGKELAVNLSWTNSTGNTVVGFLDDDLTIGQPIFAGARVIGKISDVAEAVRSLAVEEVIICLDTTEHPHLMRVIELAMATSAMVKIASPLYDVVPSRLFVEKYGSVPVVGVSRTGPGLASERYKRLFDLILVVPGLILLSPFFLLIGILIKIDSPGPAVYRQMRIGKNGKPFTFYKFRSMDVGSDQEPFHRLRVTDFIRTKGKAPETDEVFTKIVDEARITRVGKWLRKPSLDELPQLFNVLKGDMSLVGPRPCLPYEWEHYQEWHKRRLSVMPGCTGMWQVSGRSIVSFDDMVVLDLYYIHNASLLMDLRLLIKTLPVMIFGDGAK